MANLTQVVNGLSKYIDSEIVNKVNGYQRWLLGVGTGIALNKSDRIYNQLKEHSLIKMLDIIHEDGSIDIETIYHELKRQSSKGPAVFDIPAVGQMTLTESDVDKLYNYIMEG